MSWLVAPFLLQAIAMAMDELWFHRKRGLPKWERLGHPLDTLTVLACFAFANFTTPTGVHLTWYAVAAFFSCVFVTKDEFVHRARCSGGEQWLHAMLFVLHPIVLFSAFQLWRDGASQRVLQGQLAVLGIVLIYQIAYWSVPSHLHAYKYFIKPSELDGYCQEAGLQVSALQGMRPRVFTRSFFDLLRTGLVADDFRFVFTRSKLTGYVGIARKI